MATRISDQSSLPTNPGIDEVSPNTSPMFTDAGTQAGDIPETYGEAGSPSMEAEILLRALRNVIIPLTRPADGEYKHDANQDALGPDGEQFVIALKKFMSSFLRSKRGSMGGIEVELEDEGTVISTAESQEPPDSKENTNQKGRQPMKVLNEESPNKSVVSIRGSTSTSNTDIFGQQKLLFIERVRHALRKHVFDTMPIRLLCFKQDASKFKITLTERGELFSHIASNLENGLNFADVFRKITPDEDMLEEEPDPEQAVIKELICEYSRYAILSHTWLRGTSGEVTYGDWIRGEFDVQQPGYQKLVNFCRTAWKDHGVGFGWMDTICINKESSAELDESIRSMYRWYSRAHVCITYLADTVTLSDMHNDTWFSRGWTLQELLAPSNIKFYNTHWNKLIESNENDKNDSVILDQIEEATTITPHELKWSILFLSISRRMEMAAKRQVTREEDSAYSLMGIFDVSMATAYGEGAERAFSRLLQEILNSTSYGVADIFNWAGSNFHSHISYFLPSSLQDYLHRSSSPYVPVKPVEPIMVTHLGLRITILLMAAILIQDLTESQHHPFGDYHAMADISSNPEYDVISGTYSVLDARVSNADSWTNKQNLFQLMLGILNVGDGKNAMIRVPGYCLAVVLQSNKDSPFKVPTSTPITFTLNKIGSLHKNGSNYYIKRSELERHGMKLATIVL